MFHYALCLIHYHSLQFLAGTVRSSDLETATVSCSLAARRGRHKILGVIDHAGLRHAGQAVWPATRRSRSFQFPSIAAVSAKRQDLMCRRRDRSKDACQANRFCSLFQRNLMCCFFELMAVLRFVLSKTLSQQGSNTFNKLNMSGRLLLQRQFHLRAQLTLNPQLGAFRPAKKTFNSSAAASIRNGSPGRALAITTALAVGAAVALDGNRKDSYASMSALPASGDIVSIGEVTKEKATGIAFPALCNGMSLVGTGVRIKYMFVKVYAVGTYMDPIAMMAVKKADKSVIEQALLNPDYPRTLRIVMNRSLSIDKYTAAIVESLEPRMKGQDLEK